MSQNIAKKDLFAYGCLAMPLAFASVPIYINAPDFYATKYGISLTTLGFLLLALRFIDAVQDPLIGYFSDKYSNLRSFFIFYSLVVMAISFLLLFYPIGKLYIAWFCLMVFLSTTAFSVVTINLNTIGAMWSNDKNLKTVIAGYREIFGILGLILAITLPSVLQNMMGKKEAFLYASFVLIFLIFVTSILFFAWFKRHGKNYTKLIKSSPEFSQKILGRSHEITLEFDKSNSGNDEVIKNIKSSPFSIPKRTKKFFAVYAFSMLASAIPAVLVIFFIRDRLGLEKYTGLFLLVYFLSGAIGIAIWQKLSKRFSKQKTWFYAMILAVLSFTWAAFLQEGDFWQYLLICLFSGIAFGADLVLPHSILADYIQEENEEKNAASYYGILAFLAKICFALSAAISLPFLETVGFVPAQENSQDALVSMSIMYGAVPCFIKLFTIFLLWRTINENKTSNNRGYDNAN
jgi:Na+/melibiose symporter-like transporter